MALGKLIYLCLNPAHMEVTTTVCRDREGGANTTGVGTVCECRLPRPSWPYVPQPKENRQPVSVRARECRAPQLTAAW